MRRTIRYGDFLIASTILLLAWVIALEFTPAWETESRMGFLRVLWIVGFMLSLVWSIEAFVSRPIGREQNLLGHGLVSRIRKEIRSKRLLLWFLPLLFLSVYIVSAITSAIPFAIGWFPSTRYSQIPRAEVLGNEALAVVIDRSRDATRIRDFLRFRFIDSSRPRELKPRLGPHDRIRVFMTSADFFRPPLSSRVAVEYAGLAYDKKRDLVVIRCPNSNRLDPILATWPNVLRIIKDSVDDPRVSSEDRTRLTMVNVTDTRNEVLSASIKSVLDLGAPQLSANPQMLKKYWGIFPAFTGLGFAVAGSSDKSMSAEETLRWSIVPEYLVKNVTLAEADCSCIQLSSNAGREYAPLDVDFVKGSRSSRECRKV